MSLHDLTQILNVPGQLAYNPTQAGLAQPYPHGGTELGWVRDFHVEELELGAPQRAEELGFAVGWSRGYLSYGIGFVLQQYDPDALSLYYKTTNFSQNNRLGALSITENTPGDVTQLLPLVFSPYDLSLPGVIVYAPVPYLGPALRKIGWQINRPLEVPMLFMGTTNANGKVIRWGRLENLPAT